MLTDINFFYMMSIINSQNSFSDWIALVPLSLQAFTLVSRTHLMSFLNPRKRQGYLE